MVTTAKNEFYASGFPKEMQRAKYDLTLNERLREARKRKGYSLKKVVELFAKQGIKTGVSTIQGYECPEDNINHRYPNVFMLKKLMELYEVSADFLFDNIDEMNIPSHDLGEELNNINKVKWRGKPISNGQRALISEKIDEIMSV